MEDGKAWTGLRPAEPRDAAQPERSGAAAILRGYERLLDAQLAHLSLDALVQELLQRTCEVVRADAAGVLSLEEDGHLQLRALAGIDGVDLAAARVPPGVGFAGHVVATGRPVVVHDPQADGVVQRFFADAGHRTLVGVPLVAEGRAVGVLEVGSRLRRPFTDGDLRLLQVAADRVAMALDRARLRERAVEHDAADAEPEPQAGFSKEALSMASHDLKTPLTALKLQSALLAADLPPEQRAKAGDVLQRNLRRLELLLDDFLDMVRLEAGAFALRDGPVDLAALGRELGETFAAEALDRGLRLHADVPGPLPVSGDDRRLVQLVSNLLSHAIRSTPEGGRIAMSGRDAGTHVELRVQDTGHGLTPDQAARLFQAFGQAPGARDDRAGAGLGMWLAHQVAQHHGGDLQVHSDGKDQGSTFTLRLPKAQPEPGTE